jgi:death on curing protein
MNEPIWISKRVVLALHDEQLAEHGGSTGIRDENLLDSALAKPHNVFACTEDTDLFRLAAFYAFGLARNHAFIDGNKRTALVVSLTFLDRNGWDVIASKEDLYFTFYDLAEGSLIEDELTAWFTQHTAPIIKKVENDSL